MLSSGNQIQDISYVPLCLVIPQFQLLSSVVNTPLIARGRLAGGPLGTKARDTIFAFFVRDARLFYPDATFDETTFYFLLASWSGLWPELKR